MSPNRPDRPPVLIPLLGLVLLVFLAGTAVADFRVFPYPQLLRPAYLSLRAEWERVRLSGAPPSRFADELSWRRARTDETGVTRHDSAASWGDYTLYTSTHAAEAYLVDARGRVAHRWGLPFRQAFPDPDHVGDPVPDERVYWSRARLAPDGRLLVNYVAQGDTPYGYGLVEVDADSNLLWAWGDFVHHDVQRLDDGTILTLVHSFRDVAGDPVLDGLPLDPRILQDEIVRLSADGEEVARISLVDAFARSPFRWVLTSTFLADEALPAWDLLHANAVRPVSAAWASHHAFAEEGMLLVSLRSPSLLALVDPASGEVVWMSRSFWRFQHDPHALDDGGLMLFDNQGHQGPGDRSRILELDPVTGALAWEYAGTEEDPFYSQYSSHLQPLPGGNVLVTSSNEGRLFEVTRDGRIVWEFWNPARAEEDGVAYVASVLGGTRFTAEDLPFLRTP